MATGASFIGMVIVLGLMVAVGAFVLGICENIYNHFKH